MSNADRTPPLVLSAALVFAAALAFYLGFADYGFHREDEGALLMQFWLWSTGELPHRDFHLGYTPGVFFLHKTLMQIFGPGILPGRYLLAAVNSMSAALLFVTGARVTGSRKWGLLAPLFFVAAVPVYAGEFAAFNIPYPVWYSVLLFLATATLVPGLLREPRVPLLLACGLLAGLGFTFKPNVGLFQLAATALVCLLAHGRPDTRGDRVLWWSWWLATLAGLVVVFLGAQSKAEMAWFLAPPFAAAIAVARDAHAAPRRRGGPSLFACAALLGAGFAAVCVPWLAWSYSILGPDWFARRALFLGAGFESFYYLAAPPAGPALVALFLVAGAWGVPRVLERRGVSTWLLPPLAVAFAAAAFAWLAATRPMPQGLYAAVMTVVEPGIYSAAACVEWALLALWLLHPAELDGECGRADFLRPTLVCGVLLYLQIFPRTDLMHWVTAAPLLFPVAAWLLQSLARRWSAGESGARRGAVAAALLIPVAALALFRVGHFLDARWDWAGGSLERTPETTLRIAHAPISINAGRADTFRELEAAAAYVTSHSAPGDPVFTFPALDYVSYFSLRKPGNRHGYYFPGWPGHDAEAEVLVSLARRPPPLAVTLQENQLYFGSASAYYFLFADFFESGYRRVARRGPYTFFAPNDGGVAPDASAAPGPPLPVAPDAIADALGAERVSKVSTALESSDAETRRSAARRMAEWSILDDFAPLRRALADPEASVRSAAVKAVPKTRAPAVRDALLAGVVARAFTSADSVLAIRASNLACDVSCVPPLVGLTEGYDAEIAAAARGLLGELPIGRWQRDFWWKWEGDGTEPFDEPALSKLRAALEHRDADPELRIVAFAFADRLGLGSCPAALADQAALRPEDVGPDFKVCTALHHLSRTGCPGPWLDASLRWLPLDQVVSTRTALREAGRDRGRADALVSVPAAARLGTASAMALWICGMTGDGQCLEAARRTLAGSASEEERIAAGWAWSQLAPDEQGLEALRTLVANDASPQVRETAAYGIELRRLRQPEAR